MYYLDEWLNIDNGISYIICSNLTDAYVENSTMINSTAIGKEFIGVTIIESWVDPSIIKNSTITGGSNVTESNVTFSNITFKSNVSYSEVHYSNVNHSNVSNSTVNNSNVGDSYIHNSTIYMMTVGNANITDCYMYSGWLVYNGTNYSAPPVLFVCGLYEADNEPPVINTVEINPLIAGIIANITVNATDNVGVANVSANNTVLSYLTGDLWRGQITIPSTNGIYPVPLVAMDYAGNNGSLTAYLIVNLSDDPNVTLDLEDPFVGPIWPNTATAGIEKTFYANVSDDVAVNNCTLYIDDFDVGSMTDTLPSNETTVSKTHKFDSPGTYKLHAGCYDAAGRFINGTDVDVSVTSQPEAWPIIIGPGGNVPTTTGLIGLTIIVPENISIPHGSTKTLTAMVINSGNTTISNVILIASGIPDTWYVIAPEIVNLPIGSSNNFTVTIVVPSDEQTGTRPMVFTASGVDIGEGVNTSASNTTILTIQSGPEACTDCPGPGLWSECVDGRQNRTLYTCDAESNYECIQTREIRSCGGITGLFLGDPAVGAGIIILIIAGVLVYLYFYKRSTFDKILKTLRLDSLIKPKKVPEEPKEEPKEEVEEKPEEPKEEPEEKPEPEPEVKAEEETVTEPETEKLDTSFDFSVEYTE